jgi:hypothetical protein
MKVKSWKNKATPLKPDVEEFLNEEEWEADRSYMHAEYVNDKENGGFWERPFSG